MSRTQRWFNFETHRWIDDNGEWVFSNPWKQINPNYHRHDDKKIRVKLNRQLRHKNKINVRKGHDIVPVNTKTRG